MEIKASTVEAGQHVWIKDELWLVAEVRKMTFGDRVVIVRSNDDRAHMNADAMVTVYA
jgi:hypothetical protein